MSSPRAQVIDRMITGPRYLHAILDRFAVRYNRDRPRRALNRRPPGSAGSVPAAITDLTTAKIRRRGVPSGLIHEYQQAA